MSDIDFTGLSILVVEDDMMLRRRLAAQFLENLIHNGLKVTPRGKQVRAVIADDGQGVACEVCDQGPGFAEHLAKNPFMPCHSTHGGAGLGLAISNRLAIHLGGELQLKRTSPSGSVVGLSLPLAALATEETALSVSLPTPARTQPEFAIMRKS